MIISWSVDYRNHSFAQTINQFYIQILIIIIIYYEIISFSIDLLQYWNNWDIYNFMELYQNMHKKLLLTNKK